MIADLTILWVYPRVCGGTLLEGAILVDATGLSPRVRGNPPGRVAGTVVMRWVYPRVCGGTFVAVP